MGNIYIGKGKNENGFTCEFFNLFCCFSYFRVIQYGCLNESANSHLQMGGIL